MKLFFDTETTGKANFRAPVSHPSQPHIVQLAAILFTDDAEEVASPTCIIKPDGWDIPAEAASIHGISTEKAFAVGIPLISALSVFSNFANITDTIIAHNIDFDLLVTTADAVRCNHAGPQKCVARLDEIEKFCTMKATTALCKIPGNYGDYKWPKLTEAHKHLFGTDIEGAHDAMVDVRACARIYFEITKQKQEVAA